METTGMTHCSIRTRGHLDPSWQAWFGLKITCEETGNTLLSGTVSDQAALYRVLLKIHNLGLILLSLETSKSGNGNNDNDTNALNFDLQPPS
jgi:hypothetical protein